jgi:hypothetical protein
MRIRRAAMTGLKAMKGMKRIERLLKGKSKGP